MDEGESKVDGAGTQPYTVEDTDSSCVEHFSLAGTELDGWLVAELGSSSVTPRFMYSYFNKNDKTCLCMGYIRA